MILENRLKHLIMTGASTVRQAVNINRHGRHPGFSYPVLKDLSTLTFFNPVV